jgi:hypothetical protein
MTSPSDKRPPNSFQPFAHGVRSAGATHAGGDNDAATLAQMAIRRHHEAAQLCREASLLQDPGLLLQASLALMAAEKNPAITQRLVAAGRRMVTQAELQSSAGHGLLVTRMNDLQGKMSSSDELVNGPSAAIEHAASTLTDLLVGSAYMQGRTCLAHYGRTQFNRRKPQTGVAAFDAAALKSGGFILGNVASPIQVSTYIRAHSQILCNGRNNPEGHLRKWDLERFKSKDPGGQVPASIIRKLEELPDEEHILYRVSHQTSTGRAAVHGWVLTDAQTHRLVYSVDANEGGWTARYSAHSTIVMEQAKAAFSQQMMPGAAVILLHIDRGQLLHANPSVVARSSQQLQLREMGSSVPTSFEADQQETNIDRPTQPRQRG